MGSALSDARFDPISSTEVPYLECGVSLLHSFEAACQWDGWTIGIHGVRLKWKGPSGRSHSATFLPEIAKAQGWDHLATIQALVRKAGQDFDQLLLKDMEVVRYQSSKAVVSYREYVESKNSK